MSQSFWSVGVLLVIPAAFFFLRLWFFGVGAPGTRYQKIQRISQSDGHLSLDERIAEKLRELEKQQWATEDAAAPPPPTGAPPSPASAPTGFGRRKI